MEIVLPKLTEYQKKAFDFFWDDGEKGKMLTIKAPRQVGKTFFNVINLLYTALLKPKSVSIIVEPSVFLAHKVYNDIVKAMDGSRAIRSSNGTTCEIEFTNGASIICRSIESMSRGLTVTGILIIDETAWIDDDSIYTLLPLINAHNAGLILTSSPFTAEGYFHEMYIKGMEGNPKIKSFDWSKEKGTEVFLTEEKKALYRAVMSRNKYMTEILGEFLTDDGLLFTNISECIGEANPNDRVLYLGIDFATGSDGDFTVLTAVNGHGEMVKQMAVNDLSPTKQVQWLIDNILKFRRDGYSIRTVVAERNSIGAVYLDYLRQGLTGINIVEFQTTNESKRQIIDSLQKALENREITLINDPVLLNELRKFQCIINPTTKTVRYEGKNAHDDRVMSLAFAYNAYSKQFGQFEISFA